MEGLREQPKAFLSRLLQRIFIAFSTKALSLSTVFQLHTVFLSLSFLPDGYSPRVVSKIIEK